MSLIIFTIIGLITVFLFETVIPPSMIDSKYTHALDPLQFILSFIFLKVWNEAFEGYSNGPGMYRRLCFKIQTISDKFFSFHTKRGEKLEYIMAMRDALIGCIVFGYKMFAAADSRIFEEKVEKGCHGFESRQMIKIINKYSAEESAMIPVTMLRDIIKLINACVRHGEHSGHLTIGDMQVITKEIEDVYKSLEEIDYALNIQEPQIFNTHNIFTLFVYFAIWQPFVMWVTLGFWPTVISYPLVMFLLIGVVVYRTWLSDAFDPGRPMRLHNYAIWKKEFIKSICENYESEIRWDSELEDQFDNESNPENKQQKKTRKSPNEIQIDVKQLNKQREESNASTITRDFTSMDQRNDGTKIANFLYFANTGKPIS